MLIHRLWQGGKYHCVGVDDERAAAELADYMLDKGYTDLAFVGGPPASLAQKQKRNGFLRALQQRGIPARPEWIAEVAETMNEAAAQQAVERLLAGPDRPRGVLAASDEIAFGALAAARKYGLDVPQELAVAGIDDRQRARYSHPSLTAMHLPWKEMVELATKYLIQLIEYEHTIEQIQVRLATRLVVRDSA